LEGQPLDPQQDKIPLALLDHLGLDLHIPDRQHLAAVLRRHQQVRPNGCAAANAALYPQAVIGAAQGVVGWDRHTAATPCQRESQQEGDGAHYAPAWSESSALRLWNHAHALRSQPEGTTASAGKKVYSADAAMAPNANSIITAPPRSSTRAPSQSPDGPSWLGLLPDPARSRPPYRR